MRWLLVSSQHHPTQGGIGTYVHRFITAATKHGWHVELLTRPSRLLPPASRVHEVVTVDTCDDFESRVPALRRLERIRPYRYGLWSLAVARQLLELRNHFDAIEFVDCQAEGYVALASRAVREHFRGTPMIVHAHTPMFLEECINGADVKRFGRAIYHQWERCAFEMADGVIATSALLRDRIDVTAPTSIIPYIIQADINAAPQPRSSEILFVGTIQPRKGVVEWIASLNKVFERNTRATAALIGPDTPTAPDGTSMMTHALRRLRPEFRHRVNWLGPMPHEQVITRMASAAMVVVPSQFESFSFAAAEALCCGTPVIVSDHVGLAEHVSDLMTFAAEDVHSLAAAQLGVLHNSEAAREQALRCRIQLLDACAPGRTLALRQAFVDEIKSRGSRDSSRIKGDGIDEMEAFIRDVERSEAGLSLASASSAVS